MDNLVSIYATVVTIVLFFQGLEISRWAEDVRVLRRQQDTDDELARDKRVAREFISVARQVNDRYPSPLTWLYVGIQAILIGATIAVLIPRGFQTHQLWATLPFAVLFCVCVIIWPVMIYASRHCTNKKIAELKSEHGLS